MSCFPRAGRCPAIASIVITASMGLVACTGGIGSAAAPARPDTSGSPGGPSAVQAATSSPGRGGRGPRSHRRWRGQRLQDIDPGPSPLRRLSNLEYDNTVRDLFGSDRRRLTFFPEAGTTGSTTTPRRARCRTCWSAGLPRRRRAAGRGRRREPGRRCCRAIPRAGRGRLPGPVPRHLRQARLAAAAQPAEKENLKRRSPGAGGDFEDGVAAVIQVMLLSPQFLYRYEQGAAGGGSQLRAPDAVRGGLAPVVPAVGDHARPGAAGGRRGGPAGDPPGDRRAGQPHAERPARAAPMVVELRRAVAAPGRARRRWSKEATAFPSGARAARGRCAPRPTASSSTCCGRATASSRRC